MDATRVVNIDEEKAYATLLAQIPSNKYTSIVTVGRGGMGVAQRIAYKLDIPVNTITLDRVKHLGSKSLFVDDIVCTGDTIGLIPRQVDVAVLVKRASAKYKPTFTGLVFIGEEYIKFSWEPKYE